jgi:bifunctional non-homologous end joining protein LigD
MMARSGREQTVEIEGRRLKLSNLDKPMYPMAGFTKGQVIHYHMRVAPYLLPHLKDRPVTLKRYPDGVGGQFFYEKHAPRFTPDWVQTFPVPRRAGGKPIRYILINDLATLAWSANLANLEIHPSLHRVPDIQKPTVLAFDLDPGEGSSVLACARVAFPIRDLFERVGSEGLPESVRLEGHSDVHPAEHARDLRPDASVRPHRRAIPGEAAPEGGRERDG